MTLKAFLMTALDTAVGRDLGRRAKGHAGSAMRPGLADLAEDGYVLKSKEGRRNRYHIQPDLPLGEEIGRARTTGDVLDLLVEADTTRGGQKRRR